MAACLLAFLISWQFAFLVAAYIIASRLYSNRTIRFKRFPILGFLIVFIFQGAWIFCSNIIALSSIQLFLHPTVLYAGVASSCFIGTIYPLTQIYQHKADQKDGVRTLSMLLGIKGTFIFSALLFLVATCFVYLSFSGTNSLINFWLFNGIMLPATLYFFFWAWRSFKDSSQVTFKNTMYMLILSALLNNLYFLILLFK